MSDEMLYQSGMGWIEPPPAASEASTQIEAEQLGLSAPYVVVAESETATADADNSPATAGPEVAVEQTELGDAGGWLHPYNDLRGLAGPVGLTGLVLMAQQRRGPSVPAIPPQTAPTETTGTSPTEREDADPV